MVIKSKALREKPASPPFAQCRAIHERCGRFTCSECLWLKAKRFKGSQGKVDRHLVRLLPRYALGALSALLLLTFSELSLAQEDTSASVPIVNVRNAGAFVCEDVLPALISPGREIEKTAFLQWTAAYATAAARSNGLIDVFPLGDTSELVLMVRLVCRENPAQTYETALRATIGRLRNYWVRQSPEVITLNDPSGHQALLYLEAIPQLQRDLQRFGASIPVDGTYGDQTGNAVRALNESRGATPWLTPSGDLLYILTRQSEE